MFFENEITFGICYYVVKKLVLNVRIKAFWYTKTFSLSFLKGKKGILCTV